MLDRIDQNIFLKNFLLDFVKKHGDTTWSGRRYIINSDESASLLVDKLIDAMKERPQFFTFVVEGDGPVGEGEIKIPVKNSASILPMLSYFKNKRREIEMEHFFTPQELKDLIGLLQTKYDELDEKEKEEAERKRLIELEKKEREEYERLKKKYGGQ